MSPDLTHISESPERAFIKRSDYWMQVTVGIFYPGSMPRLLSSKAQRCKDFCKSSKPCDVGIHLIALTEYSPMSTHIPGFQSFSAFLHHYVLPILATTSIQVITYPVCFMNVEDGIVIQQIQATGRHSQTILKIPHVSEQ